jgi:hypothetical protein
MKPIIELITNIFTKSIQSGATIKPLGRWSIETCSKKINNKIDLSNEDHCGPCGQYAIEKIKISPIIVDSKNKL